RSAPGARHATDLSSLRSGRVALYSLLLRAFRPAARSPRELRLRAVGGQRGAPRRHADRHLHRRALYRHGDGYCPSSVATAGAGAARHGARRGTIAAARLAEHAGQYAAPRPGNLSLRASRCVHCDAGPIPEAVGYGAVLAAVPLVAAGDLPSLG